MININKILVSDNSLRLQFRVNFEFSTKVLILELIIHDFGQNKVDFEHKNFQCLFLSFFSISSNTTSWFLMNKGVLDPTDYRTCITRIGGYCACSIEISDNKVPKKATPLNEHTQTHPEPITSNTTIFSKKKCRFRSNFDNFLLF